MGLFDTLKSTISQVGGSKQETPTPTPVRASQTTVVKGTPAPAPTPDSFKVKFGSKMPYYDPVYGNLELMFNGFADVRSESWVKDPKREDFVGQIIVNTMTRGIMKAGEQKTSHKELNRLVGDLRQETIGALKEKNIGVNTLAINTIALTPESREIVKNKDQADKTV